MNRPMTILSEAVTDQSELVAKVYFEAREKGWEYLIGSEKKNRWKVKDCCKKQHHVFDYIGQHNYL